MANILTIQEKLDELSIQLQQREDTINSLTRQLQHFKNTHSDVSVENGNTNQAQDAIQSAEKVSIAKSNFLAQMSHEIRTPATAIIGLSKCILETDLTTEQFNYIEKINQSAKTLRALIDDILDFSKIEAGMLTLENKPFQLKDIINFSLGIVAKDIEKKDLLLHVDIDQDLNSSLIGDPLRLKQVLINLLTNAVKFTESGEIFLAVKKGEVTNEKIELCFTVRDTGIGIDPSKQREIFLSFQQADTPICGLYGGSGLGLAISKFLTHLMGGEISFSSILGKGTEFTFNAMFDIPDGKAFVPDFLSDSEKSVLKADFARLQGAKILLVEDNLINQDVAMAMLSQKGIHATVAADGQQALELLETEHFDCVLMDIQMPVMDGYAATRAIRAMERYADLPILAMTANALVSDEALSLKAGMNSHISKPIDIDILFTELLKWIDKDALSNHPQTPDSKVNSLTEVDSLKNETDVVDLEASLRRVAGDRDLHTKILKKFVEKHAADYQKLVESLTENKIDAAKMVTHSLKGVAQVVGSDPLHRVVTELDENMKLRDSALFHSLLESFGNILNRTIQAIEGHLITVEEEKTHNSV